MSSFFQAAQQELERACMKHPPLHSLHEAYAVILEEVEEFKAEVWKQTRDRDSLAIHDELVQIAAMCARTAQDCLPSADSGPYMIPLPTQEHEQALSLVPASSCERTDITETTTIGTLLAGTERRLEQARLMSNCPDLVAHRTLHDLVFALAGAYLSSEQQEQIRRILHLHSGYVLTGHDPSEERSHKSE
jgi:hypothetical protein